MLAPLVELTDGAVYADSADRSAEAEEMLAQQQVTSQIHERAYRHRPLTEEQKESNRQRSKIRARIEHVFGYMVTDLCCGPAPWRNLIIEGDNFDALRYGSAKVPGFIGFELHIPALLFELVFDAFHARGGKSRGTIFQHVGTNLPGLDPHAATTRWDAKSSWSLAWRGWGRGLAIVCRRR